MMREKIGKIIGNTTNLANLGSHFGAICSAVQGRGAFCFRSGFRNLRGAGPRVILDVKMEQRDAKRSQHEAQKNAKMMQNYLPTHNQSTQIIFTVFITRASPKFQVF
jgi:hypothetical protein